MLRVRSLTAQCAGNAVRSGSLGRAGVTRGGGASSALMRALSSTERVHSSGSTAIPAAESRSSRSNGLDQQIGQDILTDVGIAMETDGHQRQPGSGGETSALQQAPDERHRTSGAALTTRLKGMCAGSGRGPWRSAVQMLEKGRTEGIKDVKAYNVVLKMIANDEWMRKDKVNQIKRLFLQMKRDGLEPEVPSYNSLIAAFAQIKNEEGAVQAYEEMISRGLEPDRRTMSSMIVAHSWKSLEHMRRFAAEMQAKGWRATRRANSAMIDPFWQAKDWKGVVEVAKCMIEDKQVLTEAGFTMAIKSARNLGHADLARELLVAYGNANFRPKQLLHVSVMLALRNAGQHDACLECWRELVLMDGLGDVNLNQQTYNLALNSAVDAGRLEEMDGIVDMMQCKGVQPNEETYRAVLGASSDGKSGDVARLDRLIGPVQRREFRPSKAVLLRTAVAYTRAKRWRKAMDFLEVARSGQSFGFQAQNPTAEEVVLDALGTLARPAEVVALVDALRAEGYEPDAACCVRAADAACASGDRASAIKYCAEAEARGLAASEGAVAFAEGRSSGLEDAHEVAGSDGQDTSDSSSPSVEGSPGGEREVSPFLRDSEEDAVVYDVRDVEIPHGFHSHVSKPAALRTSRADE